ncbi:MAG: hypothetical protein P8Y25_00005 [Chromatiaceae bacterium]
MTVSLTPALSQRAREMGSALCATFKLETFGRVPAMIDIRPGNDGDKSQILERVEDVYGAAEAERAERRWDWQWQCDPRLDEPGYKGVVAEWRGRIIGTLSCLPAGLYIGGQPVRAHWCVDMLVHWGLMRQALREQRRKKGGKSPALSDGIAVAMLDHPAAGPIQLAKHIADPMMSIILRIGFVARPNTANMTRRVSLRWPLQKALGRHLGPLVAAGADLAIPGIPRPRLNVQTLEGGFDARFDQLWEAAKEEYPAITLRDSATLNWHYRQHPDTAYTVLTVGEGDVLRGYTVLKVFERRQRLLARIVDLLARNGDSEAKSALIAGALEHARQEGAERAECFAAGIELTAVLQRLGFVPKLTRANRTQPLMVRWLPDVDLYVTRGDGDGG